MLGPYILDTASRWTIVFCCVVGAGRVDEAYFDTFVYTVIALSVGTPWPVAVVVLGFEQAGFAVRWCVGGVLVGWRALRTRIRLLL